MGCSAPEAIALCGDKAGNPTTPTKAAAATTPDNAREGPERNDTMDSERRDEDGGNIRVGPTILLLNNTNHR